MARRQDERDDEPRGGRVLSGGAIAAFLVVAVLSVAGFMGWKLLVADQGGEQVESVAEKAPVDKELEARVDRLLDDLSLEQRVAQLFVARPEAMTGVGTATEAGTTTREAITSLPIGGFVYSSSNLLSTTQTKELLANTKTYAKDACGLVPFLCVVEEGGANSTVATNEAFGLKNVGDAHTIGASEDTEWARSAAMSVGSYLGELGFNVNLAPVADVYDEDNQTFEESFVTRTFASSPKAVSAMVEAQVDGYARSGILCAVKDFPGIGRADKDSHNGRIYSYLSKEDLLSHDAVPFKAAVKAGAPIIMVSHLTCLEVDRGAGDRPASLSKAVIGDMLRDELGYDEVVMTDAFEGSPVQDAVDPSEQAVLAIEAGADVVLMPSDLNAAYDGLLKAVGDGRISAERIDESVRRVIRAKLAIAY